MWNNTQVNGILFRIKDDLLVRVNFDTDSINTYIENWPKYIISQTAIVSKETTTFD